jgi:hypothetical protein
MRLVKLLIALLALAAALAAPAQADALVVGIADQKRDMFADARFGELGVGHVRLVVGWDVMQVGFEREKVDAWLDEARRAGVEPLISFGHSRVNRRSLPKPSRMRFEFRRFRERHPLVKNFAVWNEANHCGEPTCNRARLVAAYYKELRRECRSCRILAAELLDMPNMTRWVREFRRGLGFDPAYWGLHNYVDANRFRTAGTRELLRATKGRIWLTETGGIVARRNRSKTKIPEGPAHAAKATRFLFDRLVPLSRRIERVYVYHWNSSTSRDTWDSALITAGGRTRPSYRVVRRVIAEDRRPGETRRAAAQRTARAAAR